MVHGGSKLSWKGVGSMAAIFNSNSDSVVSGTSGDDFIANDGKNVTVNAGAGNDEIDNNGAHSPVNGGNDTINAFSRRFWSF